MSLRPSPRITLTDTLYPYTTRYPSRCAAHGDGAALLEASSCPLQDLGPWHAYTHQSGLLRRRRVRRRRLLRGRLRVACCRREGGRRSAHRRSGLRDPESDGKRSDEHTSELQSLMRISYAAFY